MPTFCVFCKIIDRTERSDILFEDEDLIIFKDIKPASRVHVLVVPKVHIKDAKSLKPEHIELVEKLVRAGSTYIEQQGLDLSDTVSGFHWPPFNSVSHLHLHFISPASEMDFLSTVIFKPNPMWFVTADYVLNKLSKAAKTSRL